MDCNPLVEIVKDEGIRVIVRVFLELARDKFENIGIFLKGEDPIDLDDLNEYV